MKTIHLIIAAALSLNSFAATPKAEPASKTAAKAVAGKTIVADVDGIVCAFCVQGIQKIFKKSGKANEVVISLAQKKVFIAEKEGQTITDAEFSETIHHAGFKTISITRSPLTLAEAKDRIEHKLPLVVQASEAKPVHTAAR